MRALRDIRLGWGHLGLIACISLAASAAILLGGGGRSDAQLAALAALHNPGTVTVAGARQTNPGGSGGSGSGGGSGGGGQSGGGSSNGGSTPVSNLGGGGSSDPNGGSSPAGGSTTTTTTSTTTTPDPDAGLPKVKHVFEIALSTPSYQAAFDSKTNAPYLSSLVKQGTILNHFDSLGAGSELADYLAMVGGQKPNADTAAGCPKVTTFSHAKVDKAGNVSGTGCLYPQSVTSIGYQAEFEAQTWGAYVEDQGGNCEHVNPGASQSVAIPGTDPGYDSLHNPFVYFDGLLSDGSCAAGDEDLTKLPKALSKKTLTPNFVYVAPDSCADGDPQLEDPSTTSTTTGTDTTTDTTTTTGATSTGTTTSTTTAVPNTLDNQICPSGESSGIAAEDAFLKTWVPKILASAAYKDDGVLVIAFAGSGSTSSTTPIRTGALVISKYTKRGAAVSQSFGPYSLLRSVSDMLNYPSEAQASTAKSFAKLVLRQTASIR